MDWAPWLTSGGVGLGCLVALFLALRSGALWTNKSVIEVLKVRDQHDQYLQAYIERLEARNELLDQRNDVLANQIAGAMEVARSTGMVKALPPTAAERIVEQQ